MTRRTTTPDECDEFKAAFAETRPLASKKADAPERSKGPARVGAGLDGRTAERLRRGLIDPEGRLDLHGFTESAAHAALLAFVKAGGARRARLLLVVTGRGSRDKDDAPFELGLDRGARGVLKTMVPRWLKEPEFVPHVAAAAPAHRRHGGEGALYIYLRKQRP